MYLNTGTITLKNKEHLTSSGWVWNFCPAAIIFAQL